MKKYRFTKHFEKQYKKLTTKKQDAVDRALTIYLVDPSTAKLRRHELVAEYRGQVSISAGGDLRIHLIENDEVIIVVVCVGTHSQRYKS
jgi:mRNA-degrading endonuclease YafQ of YafQ-DinJ toxin-antitoxin module